MTSLYLYAVLGAVPAPPLGEGMVQEPLRMVECHGVVAAAGAMTAAPALSPEALRGHDAVVRRLARAVDALIPARFGTLAPDERTLCERLERAGASLRDALASVTGREQMILRVYLSTSGGASAAPPRHPPPLESPGTAYLAARARAAEMPELAPLRAALERFVAAERVERNATPPLVASVYHLVARGSAEAYARAVADAAPDLRGVRVTVSGPWAPYAFAPESFE